jgi:cobalt-zinc-cadmium efflux system membrane fusion protein
MRYVSLFVRCGTLCLAAVTLAFGAGEMDSAEEMPKGPNGGRLLEDGGFSVEVTIFEQGVPPEMRLYAYEDGQPLDPGRFEAQVTLDRLGGDKDVLRFTPEQAYLVGDLEVVEPHSFDVTVEAESGGREHRWQYESHEGRTLISDRILGRAGIETEIAGGQVLTFTDTLYGVIAAPENRVYRLNAPYTSLVEEMHVEVGQRVQKGQRLVTLRNTATLQTYSLDSPTDGEVTARPSNVGDRTDQSILLEITDLTDVWVEMSAFPESIEKLVIGQSVVVYDMHQHEQAVGEISYIAPLMTSGHIARARAIISNPEGHWRPGMHIKADVQVAQREVPLAVRTTALQTFREMSVVFARFGNTFEVRMVELGETAGNFVEVLGGLKPGTEYVTGNSFLIKADILKDGASHDH